MSNILFEYQAKLSLDFNTSSLYLNVKRFSAFFLDDLVQVIHFFLHAFLHTFFTHAKTCRKEQNLQQQSWLFVIFNTTRLNHDLMFFQFQCINHTYVRMLLPTQNRQAKFSLWFPQGVIINEHMSMTFCNLLKNNNLRSTGNQRISSDH